MLKSILLSLAALIFVACSTPPPKVLVQSEPSPRCLSVKVARYFDGENEIQTTPLWINMDTETIKHIEATRTPECKEVDLTNLHVFPGLVDGHTHVFLEDRNYGKKPSEELAAHATISVANRRAQAAENLDSLLRSGFTSIRDLGNSGQYLDIEFRDSPLSIGFPRIYGSGPGIATNNGQFPPKTPIAIVNQEYSIVKSTIDVERVVREHAAKKVSLIKIYADNEPQPGLMSQDLLEAAVKVAHELDLPITAHATSDESARRAILAGVDSIEHAEGIRDQTLTLMSDAHAVMVATDLGTKSCQRILEKNSDDPPDNCSKRRSDDSHRLRAAIRDRNVSIAFGSDMYMTFSGDLKGRGPASLDSLVSYVDEGLTPLEVLRAATGNARKLTDDDRVGILRSGGYADLVAYEGDPLRSIEAIRKPKLVIKGGRVVCGTGTQRDCD